MAKTDPGNKKSDDSRKNGRKGNDGRKPERQQSGNLFWYLMIGLILAFVIFAVMGKQQRGEELAFSEFLEEVRGDKRHAANVHELVIGPSSITFQDVPQKEITRSRSSTPVDVKRFYIWRRGLGDESIHTLENVLQDKGIAYKGDEDPSDLPGLLYFLMIPLMFLLFFIFLFRRMGGAGTAMSFGRRPWQTLRSGRYRSHV